MPTHINSRRPASFYEAEPSCPLFQRTLGYPAIWIAIALHWEDVDKGQTQTISVISSSVNRRAVHFRNRYHQRGVRHRQPHPRISYYAARTLLEEQNSKSRPAPSSLVNARLPPGRTLASIHQTIPRGKSSSRRVVLKISRAGCHRFTPGRIWSVS